MTAIRRVVLVSLLPLLAVASGCGRSASTMADVSTEGVRGRANLYFPLVPGQQWLLVGVSDGHRVEERVRIDSRGDRILGVPCVRMLQEVWIDGAFDHRTTEWFSLDAGGAVWKFGERSVYADPTEPVEEWVAGRAGARPWMYLPALPEIGDRMRGRDGPDEEFRDVVATGVTEVTPAGRFSESLEVHEGAVDEPDAVDVVLYAPGIGRVSETSSDTRIVLVVPPGTVPSDR